MTRCDMPCVPLFVCRFTLCGGREWVWKDSLLHRGHVCQQLWLLQLCSVPQGHAGKWNFMYRWVICCVHNTNEYIYTYGFILTTRRIRGYILHYNTVWVSRCSSTLFLWAFITIKSRIKMFLRSWVTPRFLSGFYAPDKHLISLIT